MNIEQKKFSLPRGWEVLKNNTFAKASDYNLVFAFGSEELLLDPSVGSYIIKSYPNAQVLMNTTSGEISDTSVSNNTISLTAIHLQNSYINTASVNIRQQKNSYHAGATLAKMLDPHGLKYVMVISDGQMVNGSELALGLGDHLPEETILTGGLAGDGTRFKRTLAGINESPVEGRIIVTGFYGKISVSAGSYGGWIPFGPERLVTSSKGNVLYELDDKPALDIYKLYLGEYANELPASGLLFPLSLRTDLSGSKPVRTILSVDEKERSLTFAGNIPQDSYARFMMANPDKLIEGASLAAQYTACDHLQTPDIAILVSCVGRKLVLDQRVEEEIEVVKNVYGDKTVITGFYSYGEISPSPGNFKAELHNQTMTITTLTEN